jgi:protein required for attachment to host cells
MKPVSKLYLLASAEEFRLLKGHGAALEEVTHRKADSFADGDYEFGHSKSRNHAGKVNFDVGSARSEAEIERPRLAAHAALALEAEWDKGGYDQIVVSAGPKLLGDLRAAIPKSLEPHISAELHKDLVKLSVHDLSAHLKDDRPV